MSFQLPNGSTFDFAATYGTAVTVTAISNASTAVATATGHSLVEGDIVALTSGWVRLTGRAFRVGAVTSDTFELEGVDTTSTQRYPVGTSAGSASKVLTWVNIPQITEVASAGGEQQFYQFGFLEEDEDRQIPTTKSPSTLTLTVADDPSQPFVPVVEAADELKEQRIQRLNLVNGDIILYNSIASITNTPSLTRNQLMVRTITLAQQGRVTRYKGA
ncbi:tail constituent protein [Pseudomonas phage phiPMW]|uniref:Tail constituent protein n=1 Tax=Pseudomonas phage phiPMW TaxID=1815582 RepID=A0A1S5R1H0_9CAUD|nr:major tail protein [Pseudomonas phage phiPMW]ANA49260.1 tail constituent protein [Pseudomonas phage phiPMW]